MVGFLLVQLGLVLTAYVEQSVALLLAEMFLPVADWCWIGHIIDGLKMVFRWL